MVPPARQGWTPVLRVPVQLPSPAATARPATSPATATTEPTPSAARRTAQPEEADEPRDAADAAQRPATTAAPKTQAPRLAPKTKLPSLHSSAPSRVKTEQGASTSEPATTQGGLYYKVLYAKSKKCVRRNTKNWEVRSGVLVL